jgi:UPF0716 protein FxsA
VLFVALLAVPMAELWVILEVSERVGVLSTLGLLVVVSAAGAWLLKQQGLMTWRRLQQTLRRGGVPAREVTDGALILFGGALLLTPGFITDALGLVLLLPPSRSLVKGAARHLFGRWAQRRWSTSLYAEAPPRGPAPDAERGRRRTGAPAVPPAPRGADGSRDRA